MSCNLIYEAHEQVPRYPTGRTGLRVRAGAALWQRRDPEKDARLSCDSSTEAAWPGQFSRGQCSQRS